MIHGSVWVCIWVHLLLFRAFQMAQQVRNLPAIQETEETWVWSLGWEDPLEEEMAIHSNILSWRIPWTEEPGRLQSIGLQRVRHNWSDLWPPAAEMCRDWLVLNRSLCEVQGLSRSLVLGLESLLGNWCTLSRVVHSISSSTSGPSSNPAWSTIDRMDQVLASPLVSETSDLCFQPEEDCK